MFFKAVMIPAFCAAIVCGCLILCDIATDGDHFNLGLALIVGAALWVAIGLVILMAVS